MIFYIMVRYMSSKMQKFRCKVLLFGCFKTLHFLNSDPYLPNYHVDGTEELHFASASLISRITLMPMGMDKVSAQTSDTA